MRTSIKTILLGVAILFGGLWLSALIGHWVDGMAVGVAAFVTGLVCLIGGAFTCIHGFDEYRKGK